MTSSKPKDISAARLEWTDAKAAHEDAQKALAYFNALDQRKPDSNRDRLGQLEHDLTLWQAKARLEAAEYRLGELARQRLLAEGDEAAQLSDPATIATDLEGQAQALAKLDAGASDFSHKVSGIGRDMSLRLQNAAAASSRMNAAIMTIGDPRPRGLLPSLPALQPHENENAPKMLKRALVSAISAHKEAAARAGHAPDTFSGRILGLEKDILLTKQGRELALQQREMAQADELARKEQDRAEAEARAKEAAVRAEKDDAAAIAADRKRRREMQKLAEAYDARMGKPAVPPTPVDAGTPSKVDGGPAPTPKADTL
jgi:hypothetical protein